MTESGWYSFKRLEGDLDYTVCTIWRGQPSFTKKLSSFDSKTDPVIDFRMF